MNTNNEKPTEKAFTNNKDIDIMKQRAERAELIEPAMLLVVLIIGFLIIVCHQFNVVTSLIYIAPCVVSSVARTLESDSKNPTFIIHLAAMIAAVLYLGTILVSEYIKEYVNVKYINYFLIVYPIYETTYICVQKINIDTRR